MKKKYTRYDLYVSFAILNLNVSKFSMGAGVENFKIK